jgi:broad specificity phosphatase PhoE
MARVLLIRHGETEWSRSGQHTSRTDLPLLADGVSDAQALGRRLAGHSFALVLASPMARARATAEHAGLGDAVKVTDDLHELGYGDYEGRTTADIRDERPGWDIWAHGAPRGETLDDAAGRADRLIARAEAAEGDVALFGHGHILRIVGARWIGLPPRAGGRLALGTAALCVLGYERERRVIQLWNEAMR